MWIAEHTWQLRCTLVSGGTNLIFVWQLFAQLDTNDDGQLSKAELIKGVKGLNEEELKLLGSTHQPSGSHYSAKEISDFVTAVDSDDDKKISMDEWLVHFNVFEPPAAAADGAPTTSIETSQAYSTALVVVPGEESKTSPNKRGLGRTPTFAVSKYSIEQLTQVCIYARMAAAAGVTAMLRVRSYLISSIRTTTVR